MRSHLPYRSGFTLMELLIVIFIGFLLLGAYLIFVPRYSRGGGPSFKKMVCQSNLKGIGTSMIIYANYNNGAWAIPPFDETKVGLIDYTVKVGGGEGSVRSPNRSQSSISVPGGARQLSTTRSFWMIVRSGDIIVKQFICPSSTDHYDETEDLELYYDFESYHTISYGFQVPFGPVGTRAKDGLDNRMIIAADKGPFYTKQKTPNWNVGAKGLITLDDSPKTWRPFNSPNHGGVGKGEGQNCLYADGHVSFNRTPIVGVDHDNIYTIAKDNWTTAGRVHGESPWKRSATPFAPAGCSVLFSSTDSVIFP